MGNMEMDDYGHGHGFNRTLSNGIANKKPVAWLANR